jgi:hypothetical protein
MQFQRSSCVGRVSAGLDDWRHRDWASLDPYLNWIEFLFFFLFKWNLFYRLQCQKIRCHYCYFGRHRLLRAFDTVRVSYQFVYHSESVIIAVNFQILCVLWGSWERQFWLPRGEVYFSLNDLSGQYRWRRRLHFLFFHSCGYSCPFNSFDLLYIKVLVRRCFLYTTELSLW